MLMNPTETSALAVKPHCIALTMLWMLKGSLVNSLRHTLHHHPHPPFSRLHSVHPQLSEVLAAYGEPCRIIKRFRGTASTPRCSEQGFYVVADGFSITGCYTVSLLIKNEWRQAHCTDNYAYTPQNSWPSVMVTTEGHLRETHVVRYS